MTKNTRILNPWFSILTEPRATIQQIIDTDPKRFVLLLAAMIGVGAVINIKLGMWAPKTNIDPNILGLVVAPIGAIMAIILLYIEAALIRWVGSKFGGRATSVQVRAALAWPLIPVLWYNLLCVVVLLVAPSLVEAPNNPLGLALDLIGMAGVTLNFILSVRCLQQIQGFSVWKTLAGVLLAGCLFCLILLAVFTVVIAGLIFVRMVTI